MENMIKKISENDGMHSKEYGDVGYFQVCESALKIIKNVIDYSGREYTEIKTILDLPCGHGRVLRVMRACFPESKIYGCDIDKDGVDFCAKTFNSIPVYSSNNINDVIIDEKFDLIWVGSLLTHLDEHCWADFLNYFADHLNDKGFLIFTTHGRKAIKYMNQGIDYGIDLPKIKNMINNYDRKGFGYEPYNWAKQDEYGISLSAPSKVLSITTQITDLSIINFIEAGWHNHQDVVVCVKQT